MLSLLLHGVSVGTAIVLAADFSLIPREKPFQWNVSILTTLSPEAIVSDRPSPAAADASRHMTPTADSDGPRHVAVVSRNVVDASSPTGARPPNLRSHTLPRRDQRDRDATPEHNLASGTEVGTDIAPPNPPITQETPHAAPSSAALAFPVSAPASAELPATEVEAPQRSVLASEPSIQKVNRVIHRPPIQYRDPIVSRAFQADYGWLADMLHTQVETHKRYPSVARSNRWQGNVVLQAAVHENGDISDIVVAQTSGHTALDQNAVALLEQASPVTLKHQLGQSHVIVQIPIGYRLE